METKLKSNLSNMEQKELSKLRSDDTLVIKPADKGGAVVIISTSHHQSMIMQHLLDENTYKKPDSCTDNKIQSSLLRFLRQFKMCFTKAISAKLLVCNLSTLSLIFFDFYAIIFMHIYYIIVYIYIIYIYIYIYIY